MPAPPAARRPRHVLSSGSGRIHIVQREKHETQVHCVVSGIPRETGSAPRGATGPRDPSRAAPGRAGVMPTSAVGWRCRELAVFPSQDTNLASPGGEPDGSDGSVRGSRDPRTMTSVPEEACLFLDRIKREKGVWWMPWQQEAMKDVILCDKPWGAENGL